MKTKHLVFRAIEHVIDKPEFDLAEVIRELKLSGEEEQYIRGLIWDTSKDGEATPNEIFVRVKRMGANVNDWKYMLLPDAVFQYMDYIEVVEARKAARHARVVSWVAIIISLVIGGLQLYWQIKYSS
jgi:hypothetical protein